MAPLSSPCCHLLLKPLGWDLSVLHACMPVTVYPRNENPSCLCYCHTSPLAPSHPNSLRLCP